MFIIHPLRIFALSAMLAAVFFYAARHGPPGFVSYVSYGWGAFCVLAALAALRWIWRGFVAFFRR